MKNLRAKLLSKCLITPNGTATIHVYVDRSEDEPQIGFNLPYLPRDIFVPPEDGRKLAHAVKEHTHE